MSLFSSIISLMVIGPTDGVSANTLKLPFVSPVTGTPFLIHYVQREGIRPPVRLDGMEHHAAGLDDEMCRHGCAPFDVGIIPFLAARAYCTWTTVRKTFVRIARTYVSGRGGAPPAPVDEAQGARAGITVGLLPAYDVPLNYQ